MFQNISLWFNDEQRYGNGITTVLKKSLKSFKPIANNSNEKLGYVIYQSNSKKEHWVSKYTWLSKIKKVETTPDAFLFITYQAEPQ